MQKEYRAEAEGLAWPPDIDYPATAVEGGDEVEYQVGVGAAGADFNWMCAWIEEWEATNLADAIRSARALEQLDRADELPVWEMWDASGHNALRNAIIAARQGKPDQMERLHLGLGCEALLGYRVQPPYGVAQLAAAGVGARSHNAKPRTSTPCGARATGANVRLPLGEVPLLSGWRRA